MKHLLQLPFFLLLSTSLYCQQFIEGIKISNRTAYNLTNANNNILFNNKTLTNGKWVRALWLTGGEVNREFMLDYYTESIEHLIYANPYIYMSTEFYGNSTGYYSTTAKSVLKTDLNTGVTTPIGSSLYGFYYPVKAGNNIFYWQGEAEAWPSEQNKLNKVLSKTDGTAAGTVEVKNLNGNKNSFIWKMVQHNSNVYFLENDSTSSRLWRSNGTSVGTVVVATVFSNFNNCLNQEPVLFNGSIYFVVDYPNNESYLWKYDIAVNSTSMIKLINNQEVRLNPAETITPGNRYPVSRYKFKVWGNSLYFRGNISGQTGLWKSDGTNAGTVLLKNITGELDEFTIVNNKLYFVRSQYTNYKYHYGGLSSNPATLRELWVSDGTAAGTNIVKDFPFYDNPNPASNDKIDPAPNKLFSWNNQLFFLAIDPLKRKYIAGSDGTPGGTKNLGCTDLEYFTWNPGLDALFYIVGSYLYKAKICNNASLPASKYAVTQNANTDNSFNKPGTCDSLIALVSPGYDNTNNLSTTATVWIENKQPLNFVKRHYEITPTIGYNGLSGGRVTLYFKQAEFDDFNARYTPALPSGGILLKSPDRKNIRIAWYPGVSSDQTGLPISYQNNATIIDPDDEDIIWNSVMGCWEVSFNCTGFGGFILQTQTLPLKR